MQHELRLRSLGRHAPSRAVDDRWRARRPLALHQRQQHAAHRPDRPDAVRDRRDHRDSQLRRRPRVALLTENSEYVVSRHALQRADAATGHVDRGLQRVQRHADFRQGRPAGHMDIAFQILVPGYDYDLGTPGKGPSHGWFFFTSYNSEEANTKLEANASQKDKDFIAAVNYKRGGAVRGPGQDQGLAAPVRAQLHGRDDGIARSETKKSVKMLEPARLPRSRVLPPHAQVTARRRRRSDRGVHRRRREARDRHPGALVHEDEEGDRRQGVRRGDRRHPGAQVRRGDGG